MSVKNLSKEVKQELHNVTYHTDECICDSCGKVEIHTYNYNTWKHKPEKWETIWIRHSAKLFCEECAKARKEKYDTEEFNKKEKTLHDILEIFDKSNEWIEDYSHEVSDDPEEILSDFELIKEWINR